MLRDAMILAMALWQQPEMTRLLNLLVCWSIAFFAARAWFYPTTPARRAWIRYGLGLMVVEMVVVTMTLMFVSMVREHGSVAWWRVGLLGLFYAIFPLAMALAIRSQELWWNFTLIMAVRWYDCLHSNAAQLRDLTNRFGLAAVLYFAVVVSTVFIALPAFGITPEVRQQANIPGTGLWVEKPERAIGGLTIYYILLGVIMFLPSDWLPQLKFE